MDENVAALFEANRQRLQSVAYRMLGSLTEAEDAVQETWVRLSRSDADAIDNLGGWLTTVLSRVCLGVLRTRRSRPEEPIADDEPDPGLTGPEEEVLLADTLGPALLVVLDSLGPTERLAFVLHDLFAIPFEDIAPIVDRSPAATRQLASRARRRIQGVDGAHPGDRRRQQQIVEAFLGASRRGDLETLISLLDPDAVLRADRAAVRSATANRDRGAPLLAPEVHGGPAVAAALSGRAAAAQLALIDGAPGAVWAPSGRPRAIFAFRTIGTVVTEIEIITEPAVVRALPVQLLTQ
ncbi:MAG TPA: sigma-70 family RNA polymerase sigma factor [Acidimicrobiales bacterium]|nr:sigma-70 family RNA polymerase sigma factor [Acidimicrobiales bacterium]